MNKLQYDQKNLEQTIKTLEAAMKKSRALKSNQCEDSPQEDTEKNVRIVE